VNTCPHCGSEQIDVQYPLCFDCGTIEPYHRTGACKAREPIWKELQSAKMDAEGWSKQADMHATDAAGYLSKLIAAESRIESLVKVGDAIIENGSVSERLANEWNEAKK